MAANSSGDLPTVAAVVVSYNTAALLRNCLHSIQTAAGYAGVAVDIWVVDNAGSDGSAQMVAAEFPQVNLLVLPRNIGFTGGNNLALAALGFPVPTPPDLAIPPALKAPPTYVLLLNPDAELTVGALRSFLRLMDGHPQIGVCGAHLQYGDGRFQHGAFRFPNLAQVALDCFPLSGLPGVQRLYNSRLNGRYAQEMWEQGEPFAVDFVLGAAMFVRGRALAAAGGFDPAYWMYCEEMDLCLRLQERGWAVYAAPAVRVIHHEAQSSRQLRWPAYVRLWKSRFRFYTRHRRRYPPGYLLLLRLVVRAAAARDRRAVQTRFAQGELTGEEAGAALRALAAVAEL